MKKSTIIAGVVIFSLFFGCNTEKEASPFTSGIWIDLSYPFSTETVYWPTAKSFQLDTVFAGMTEKGYYYSAFQFCAAEHGGTHIDAPIHFARDKQTVDQIPLQRLIASAILVDVSEQALKNRDYQVSVKDFQEWEKRNGRIPDDCIVLLKTGYGRFWPDREKYMGTAARGEGAVKDLHFPGLHPEAAEWLIKARKIKAIGLDTPSIDYGQSSLFETHQILFKHDIPAFENVANLDLLPETGFFLIALPMKIKGGSGGPLRVIAWLPEK